MKRIYFSDFDGTITKVDTCNAMTQAFAGPGWEKSLIKWQNGELSTIDCSREIFANFPVTEKELVQFLLTIPVDETFHEFVHYVESRQESLYILSDGYDLNIRIILKKLGLSYLKAYSNCLIRAKEGWDISSPFYDNKCGKCGTCKRNLIQSLKKAQVQIIYIGDGYSDTCACQEADLIFAKDYLLEFCQKKELNVHPFKTFRDIITWLQAHPLD